MENLKPKEPLLAVMFGVVLTGLGQIYAGKIKRGIGLFFISGILSIPLIIFFLNPATRIISLLLVSIIIGFGYKIFVIVDGYRCAKAYNISNNLTRNITTAKKIILIVGIIVIVLVMIIGFSWRGIVGLYNYFSGENYMKKGMYDKAAESYSKVIKVMPWSAVIYQFRAYAYANQHNFDQAIADYNKSLEIKPNDAEAISRLSLMYYDRGIVYYEKNDFDKAITDYTKSIEINPNDANVYSNRGLAYADQGKLSQAISDYNKAIAMNPKDAEVYSNRGLAYYDKGSYDQAILDYSKAIEINPKDISAYGNRGNTYYKKGNYDQAISDYNKVLEINPKDAGAYCNRAAVYFDKKEYDKSWQDIHEAEALGIKADQKITEFIDKLKQASGREK